MCSISALVLFEKFECFRGSKFACKDVAKS